MLPICHQLQTKMYINTVELQADLRQFARKDGSTKTREQELPELISKIRDTSEKPSYEADDQTLGRDRGLNKLISETLGSLYAETEQDKSERVFTGEAAVFIISSNGEIKTRYDHPFHSGGLMGEVHREFGVGEGKTLLPYAIAKGIERLTIELRGTSGGIVKRENRDYLARLLPSLVIYEGDAVVHQVKDSVFDGSFWAIGVSGAQVTEEFLDRVTGSNVLRHNIELLAGMMDTLAAQSIATKISYPHLGVLPIPSRFAELTRSH